VRKNGTDDGDPASGLGV